MQITLEIQPEIAARLEAEAQARGLALERYIEVKLEEPHAANPPKAEAGIAARLTDLEHFFKEMARHSDKIPVLPEEAFTRESFYQDHD